MIDAENEPVESTESSHTQPGQSPDNSPEPEIPPACSDENISDDFTPDQAENFSWQERTAQLYAAIYCYPRRPPCEPFTRYKNQAMRFIAQFGPTDPIEEMLVTQLVLTHARISYLNRIASRQKIARWSELFSVQLDRATVTYQRILNTLLDHRRPRRRRRNGSVTHIRTTHFTAQQLITPGPNPKALHAHPRKPQSKKVNARAIPQPATIDSDSF